MIGSSTNPTLPYQVVMQRGVRMYHDQALYKEAGGGITPWHADQYYWPLETDKTITAWIPLQATPLEMGPLEFSAGSQAKAATVATPATATRTAFIVRQRGSRHRSYCATTPSGETSRLKAAANRALV